MKTKEFHFTDVLGVITMTIFRPQGFEGIGVLLRFMTGQNNLDEENYGSARVDCLPELIKQFPNLNPDTNEMKEALSELTRSLPANLAGRDASIKTWLEKFKNGKFGIECNKFLEVAQLPILPKDAGIVYVSGWRGEGA